MPYDAASLSSCQPHTGKTNFYYADVGLHNNLDTAATVTEETGAGNQGRREDQLAAIRWQLEHNQITPSSDLEAKLHAFEVIGDHLDEDAHGWEQRRDALALARDVLPHVGPDADPCMGLVLHRTVPLLGANRVPLRRAALSVLQIYLRFSGDIQGIQRAIVQYGLENNDPKVRFHSLTVI